jgi:hypothetical protein
VIKVADSGYPRVYNYIENLEKGGGLPTKVKG